jgi:hypothetical protein
MFIRLVSSGMALICMYMYLRYYSMYLHKKSVSDLKRKLIGLVGPLLGRCPD